MNILGLTITRSRALTPPGALSPIHGRGASFLSVIREATTGGWQRNEEITAESALSYWAVFACTTLIASDIGKLRLKLVEQIDVDIWRETSNPAYSPVLRKPNRYQTIHKFVEQWITSKLIWGNTYVLKERDDRGVVVALYVLDPARVQVLVAPDGSVWYKLDRPELTGITLAPVPPEGLVAPASEIIHDTMITLWHPLMGVSPLFACGLSALQGQTIQSNSNRFFANGSNPGGVLTAPGAIGDDTAQRLKAYWDTNFSGSNAGKVAVLGDGLEYQAMTVNAVDAQLIEQLHWTAETICSCYHLPIFMIDAGKTPPNDPETFVQLYYSQCLQSLIVNFERSLDEGLGVLTPINGTQYGVELDIDDLVWMDTATRTKSASEAIGGSGMTVDEARRRYFSLPPIEGGNSAYMQQQNFSLAALAKRDRDDPFSKAPAPVAPPAPEDDDLEGAAAILLAKDWSALHAS
jgi:HK97 family phage portal protein